MTLFLRVENNSLGQRNIYFLRYNENDCITVVNYTMINVNQLAKIIWPDERRFRTSVQQKSEKAHKKGEVYRLPPGAYDIYVDVAQVRERLVKWCHRDPKAREQLQAFDFDELRRRVRDARKRRFQAEADAHEQEANEHLAKRRRLIEQINDDEDDDNEGEDEGAGDGQ